MSLSRRTFVVGGHITPFIGKEAPRLHLEAAPRVRQARESHP